MEKSNRLYRSNTEKVIGGVAGGLADYLNVDPVLLRVAFVLLVLFGGGGILIYIVMWIAIPAEPISLSPGSGQDTDTETIPATDTSRQTKNNSSNTALIAGVLLILAGLLFLADRLMPFYNLRDFWPVILIIAGVLVIKPDIFKTDTVKNDKKEDPDEAATADIVEPKNIES